MMPMSDPTQTLNRLAPDTLDYFEQQARRDDWHQRFVGSDIRMLIGEIRRLQAEQQGEISVDVDQIANTIWQKIQPGAAGISRAAIAEQIRASLPAREIGSLWKPIAELEWCGEYLFGFWMEHIPMQTQEFQVHHLELTESGLLTMDGNHSDFNRDDFEVFMPIPKANKPEIEGGQL
jgi:hypothetical protein